LRNRLAKDLLKILTKAPKVTLAIECMTHRCSGETAKSLGSLRRLIHKVNMPGRLKVCIDLCHLYVAQHDLFLPQGREALFVDIAVLGPENVAAFHISDSGEIHGGTEDKHLQ